MKLSSLWIVGCVALSGCTGLLVTEDTDTEDEGSTSSSTGSSTSGTSSSSTTTTVGSSSVGPTTLPTDTSPSGPTTLPTDTNPTEPSGTSTGSTSLPTGVTTSGTGPDDTTGTTWVSSSSTGETETGPSFIGKVDFPPGVECNAYLQDCPDGEKCSAWANDGGSSWNALRCVPVDPNPDQAGDVCTVEGSGVSGIDSCDVGVMCFYADNETNEGTCVELCTGSAEDPVCNNPNTSCIISNQGVLNLCIPSCDPLLQDCPEGQGCYSVFGPFACVGDASGEGGLPGDPCEFINACEPGNECLAIDLYGPSCSGFSSCCSPYCDVSDPTCTVPGHDCVAVFEEGTAPMGFEDVGVCQLPA